MPQTQRFEYTVLSMIEDAARAYKAQPLNLGGVGGVGGGVGGPPGGFIGRLPQYQVAYDIDELATLSTLPSGVNGSSGWSLVDNLNHIRYRLGLIESGGSGAIAIFDDNTDTLYSPVDTLHFSGGVVINDLGGGDIQVVITASGGGGGGIPQGGPLTELLDGNGQVIDNFGISNATLQNTLNGNGQAIDNFGISNATLQNNLDANGQGIINLPNPSNPQDAATKDYVDSITPSASLDASGYLFFNLTTDSSDIGGYWKMINRQTGNSGLGGTVSGADTNFATYATEPAFPVAVNISSITVNLNASSASVSPTGVTVDVYAELYTRDGGGTETLLGTSDTVNVPNTEGFYTLTFSSGYAIAETDRLVLKLYGSPNGGSPSLLNINLNLGIYPLSDLEFKADYNPVTGVYFDNKFTKTTVETGTLIVSFDKEGLTEEFLRLDTDNGGQEIVHELNVVVATPGEQAFFATSLGDSYTGEFDQWSTDAEGDVFSPDLWLWQGINGSVVSSGIALLGERYHGDTSSFIGEWILLMDDDLGIQFKVDKDGITYAPGFESTDKDVSLVLKSPDGTRWRITVDNAGSLTTTAI